MKNTRLMTKIYIYGTKRINAYNCENYVRKETSLLDVYAKVFSLWMSLYSGISFLFSKLYSKSFDKYKIIENILSRQKENLLLNKEPKFMKKR